MADHQPPGSSDRASSFVYRLLTIPPVFIRIGAIAALLAGVGPLHIRTSAAELTSVEVGYQRRAVVGEWMPVEVAGSGLSAGQNVSLVLVTRDARGNRVTEVCSSATADSEGRITLQGLARTGRLDGTIEVALQDADSSASLDRVSIACSEAPVAVDDDPLQRRLRMYRHDVRFLLTVGAQAGLDELLERAEQMSPDSPALVGVSVASVEQLPQQAEAYDVFSSIVFNGSVSLSDAQFAAIRAWVYRGGQLIIGCADELPQLLETPFGQWLDQHFEFLPETRSVTDADLAAMQQVVPQSTRISTFRRKVNMALLESDQVVALARSGSVPLVSRIGSGGGTLTFIAVNLNRRPLSQWNSLADFYAVMILGSPLNKVPTRGSSSRISSSGISDLTTQLMATVDPQPKTGRWSAWSIIGLAFGWLVLIGPVDYFVVVVLLKRPQLTWVTFPLWVILACWGLYSLKSAEPQIALNSVHLVDVTQDGSMESVRAVSLMSLSTPWTARTRLTAVPHADLAVSDPQVSLSWSGRPDDVYGGMYRATGIGGGSQAYTHHAEEADTLDAVPLLIDGSFETRATWTASPDEQLTESSFSVSGFGLMNGSFSHQLPSPLRDWVVVFGNRIYRARDDARASLPAGQTWEFQPGGSQISDLKSYLTGPRDARESPARTAPGQAFASQAYSVEGRDPLDIVTMMTLYDMAGADNYTGLNHDAMKLLDMSDSIRLNYAVVIGWMELPATLLQIDGEAAAETETTTIVRLLLPVDRRPASASAMTKGDMEEAERARQNAADADSSEPSTEDAQAPTGQDETEQETSSD